MPGYYEGTRMGSARFLVAPNHVPDPDGISDIIKGEEDGYEEQGEWYDIGAIKSGYAIRHGELHTQVGSWTNLELLNHLRTHQNHPFHLVLLRQIPKKNNKIVGEYFQAALVKRLHMGPKLGERSTAILEFRVGPTGYRHLK